MDSCCGLCRLERSFAGSFSPADLALKEELEELIRGLQSNPAAFRADAFRQVEEMLQRLGFPSEMLSLDLNVRGVTRGDGTGAKANPAPRQPAPRMAATKAVALSAPIVVDKGSAGSSLAERSPEEAADSSAHGWRNPPPNPQFPVISGSAPSSAQAAENYTSHVSSLGLALPSWLRPLRVLAARIFGLLANLIDTLRMRGRMDLQKHPVESRPKHKQHHSPGKPLDVRSANRRTSPTTCRANADDCCVPKKCFGNLGGYCEHFVAKLVERLASFASRSLVFGLRRWRPRPSSEEFN